MFALPSLPPSQLEPESSDDGRSVAGRSWRWNSEAPSDGEASTSAPLALPPPPPPLPTTTKRKRPTVPKAQLLPSVKPKTKPSIPLLKQLPSTFLRFTEPSDLQSLLLKAAALSPKFNVLLSSSVDNMKPLLEGNGKPNDFKKQFESTMGFFRQQQRGDNEDPWNQFIEGLEGISGAVHLSSPLLTKISALEVLYTLIKTFIDDYNRTRANLQADYTDFQQWHGPGEMWWHLYEMLINMTEHERRKKISSDLVARLDEYIPTQERRRFYGRKGRDVGEEDEENDEYYGEETRVQYRARVY